MFSEDPSSGLTFDELRKQVGPSPRASLWKLPTEGMNKAYHVLIKPGSEPQLKNRGLFYHLESGFDPSLFRGNSEPSSRNCGRISSHIDRQIFPGFFHSEHQQIP
jgi:hypothetical protein